MITPHGKIQTPAFVSCATKGTLKSLTPEDVDNLGIQLLFVNTYHLVLSPGVAVVEKAGGIHNFSKIRQPIITDSGGFQVFSLNRPRLKSDVNQSQVSQKFTNYSVPYLVKISDDGVKFRSSIDGTEFYFTPEFSLEAQIKIGADFIVAFDECLPAGASRKQTEQSVARTHDWAVRSLRTFKLKINYSQFQKKQQLYGVIQGGMYQKLRQQSAEFIAALPFWGLAIGGISVGETKKEMREQVSWVMSVIQNDTRSRHLLGIGELDDIVEMVKMGIDTFDCVIPTRHARMGKLYTDMNIEDSRWNMKEIDIFKTIYKADLESIDVDCACYTCQNFSRAYLHHLFKQRELLGYRLATIHNLFFMERLFTAIRQAILESRL